MCKMKSSRSSSPVINNQIKQETDDDDEESLKPLAAWKSRTKIRKPKFLSLSSKIIPQIHAQNNTPPPKSSSAAAASSLKSTNTGTMTSATRQQHKQQLNLFPLHPENPVDQQDDNVALFFQSDGGATLNGLLTSPETTTTTTTTTMSSDLEEESFSPYAHYREKQGNIVRTAMRSRERDQAAAEKWVCYSDLVAEMKEEIKEETAEDCSTSTANTAAYSNWEDGGVQLDQQWRSRRLALKLDYQEILDAWSDKGPLCIDGGDSPQTVPDLMLMQDDQHFQPHDHTPSGSAGNSWSVPEGGDDSVKTKTAEQREASVMRYKEKRHNRLFSKRIRYEVRKLNAEKRPRIKGRFVKRSA